MNTSITIKSITEAESGKRICEMSEDEIIEMIEKIPVMSKMIGISAEISNEELLTLEKIIRSSFPNLTSSEISLSFQAYITGDIDIPKEFNHYGQFNLKFFGQLFREYQNRKIRAKKERPSIPSGHILSLDEASPESRQRDSFIKVIQYTIENGKLPDLGNFHFCFLHLKRKGLINPTKEELEETVEEAKLKIVNDANEYKDSRKIRDHISMFKEGTEGFKNVCREVYFKRWIQDQMIQNIDTDGSSQTFLHKLLKEAE